MARLTGYFPPKITGYRILTDRCNCCKVTLWSVGGGEETLDVADVIEGKRSGLILELVLPAYDSKGTLSVKVYSQC